MGLSAMTLPTGVPSCGLMLLGGPMDEERLLRVAAANQLRRGRQATATFRLFFLSKRARRNYQAQQ